MGKFSPFHPGMFAWMLIGGLLYFLPAFVGRKKRTATGIFWLNLFLGWTVAGWLVALIWALTQDPLPTEVIENHPVQEWVRCTSCGKYSPPDAKFCSSCGARISTESP
jgi:Superinfection immunity protein/zinc-ribbon domain